MHGHFDHEGNGVYNARQCTGVWLRPSVCDACRRRMPKQLYVSLPCATARSAMLQRQFYPQGKVKTDLSTDDISKVVQKTDGYSGADMKNLIQEACQGPVREVIHLRGSDGVLLLRVPLPTCLCWLW